MINVITIDREYGSGGKDIARKLGERLGWPVWDERLTIEIARLMDCDSRSVEKLEERRDPMYYRLLKGFLRGSAEGVQNVPTLKMVDADCIREFTERVVLAAAREHSILVGRGSAYYLHNRPDAFHVFVYAPMAEKVRRLQRAGTPTRDVTELLDTTDRDRAAFVKKYFDVEWPGRDRFHLMINSTIGDDAVVEMIRRSVAVYEETSP